MAFYKHDTLNYGLSNAGKEQFAYWLVDIWKDRGWTEDERSVNMMSQESWHALSRTVNYTDGSQQGFYLVCEFEWAANDFTWYARNPGDSIMSVQQDPRTLTANTNWGPFYSGKGGVATAWFDDASDAFLLYLGDNNIWALQFPDGGWINNGPNEADYYWAGTRPIYGNLPVSTNDYGYGHYLNDSSTWYPSNAITRHRFGVDGRWTDYCALGVGNSASYAEYRAWEDQSGTWKMLSEKFLYQYNNGALKVVQIGDEYYISTGQFLLPCGQTEPAL